MEPEQIWDETLIFLQRKMTQATYSTLFMRSGLVVDNGQYTIQVESEMAREWLEHRLAGVVAQTLGAVLEQRIAAEQLKFVAKNGSSAPSADTKTSREVTFKIRERRKGGRYFIDHEFIWQGYGAVLGPYAIAVYNVLCSHANNDGQDCRLYKKTIALEAGVSPRMVQKMFKLLESHRLIEVTRHQDGKRANDLALLDVTEWEL